ncbi:hypothetical protein EDD15DRAFT_2159853 [Pisolithus albus]|nr:hypothetical protein EDD15DRAFT_2159853 [Pisolithus albus]
MSVTVVYGFFALAGGRRVKSVKAGSTMVYHCIYETTIQCTSGTVFPASLRVYSPINGVIFPDNTVAFVSAKASVPVNIPAEPVLLEAFHLVPVPGDPSVDGYEDGVPDLPYPVVVGMGSVTTQAWLLSDGMSKAFTVVSSDYVCDAKMEATVSCVFNTARARWSKTPVPNQNSLVLYVGQFGGFGEDGGLRVDLESISLNVGMQDGRSLDSASTSGAKKRKFQAVAPRAQGGLS